MTTVETAGADAVQTAGPYGEPSVLGSVGRAPRRVRWALLATAAVVALWLPNGVYPTVAVDILC